MNPNDEQKPESRAYLIIAGAIHHPEWLSELPPVPAEAFTHSRALMAGWLGVLYCIRTRQPMTLDALREGAGTFGRYIEDSVYEAWRDTHVLKSEFRLTHKEVVEAHMRAKLLQTLSGALESLRKGEGTNTIVGEAVRVLTGLVDGSFRGTPRRLSDHLAEHSLVLDERLKGKHIGLETGLVDLDKLMKGLKPGDLIVVAARPGMGKSVLGVHIAMHQTEPTLVLSMEMQAGQVIDRLLANETYLQTITEGESEYLAIDDIASGRYNERGLERLIRGAAKLSGKNMLLDDSGSLSIHAICAKTRSAVLKHNAKLLVVDYLQLAEADGESRNVEVGNISKGLKALAKELNIPVIALAQLNRNCEARVDKRPILSDLRESGNVEQDADVVAMLYRDDYYNPNSEVPGSVEVIIRKNRQGRIGSCLCSFHGDRAYIGNYERQPPMSGQITYVRRQRGF